MSKMLVINWKKIKPLDFLLSDLIVKHAFVSQLFLELQSKYEHNKIHVHLNRALLKSEIQWREWRTRGIDVFG